MLARTMQDHNPCSPEHDVQNPDNAIFMIKSVRSFATVCVATMTAVAPITSLLAQSGRSSIADIPAPASATTPAQAPAPAAPAPANPAPATTPVQAGPTVDAARAGVARKSATQRTMTMAADKHVGAGQNVALMVVGGAALLTGLIIGGDGGALVAIGGAAVGLVGLYNFIK
jgi:hypothetical protein